MKRCAEIYRVDPEKYSQFPEENNCFLRALYDTQFPSFGLDLLTNMVKLVDSGEEGFSRVDLALYAASWTIDAHMPFASKWNPKPSTKDYIPVEIVNRPPDDIPTSQLTKYVKRAAKFFGACDVGITKIDQRWIMKNTAKISAKSSESSSENTPNIRKTPVVLPEGVTNAIVIAIEMDPTG
ncbi:MAG: hypothetical protein ACTSVZ_12950, partial [Promethearchaeota archaeon]